MTVKEFYEFLLSPAAQVALIIGIAEVVKKLGLPKKFIPLVDLGLGLALGVLIDGLLLSFGVLNGLVLGVALGLSACGLFSGIKNVFGQDEPKQDETEEDEDKDV